MGGLINKIDKKKLTFLIYFYFDLILMVFIFFWKKNLFTRCQKKKSLKKKYRVTAKFYFVWLKKKQNLVSEY